ncbi:MAG: hypothetical protein CEO40_120 [Parcubacteria group bacterium LiPW_72]|nr:MAG: hypothetical protein CEO40_120 [Parcubacteria group bacterium LiPW_72]
MPKKNNPVNAVGCSLSNGADRVNNQSLLNEIEKMLSAPQGRDYLKNNALLGFCAQLIAMRPEARDNYRQYLKQRLVALYPRKRKIDWKQKIVVSRLLPLRQLFTLRTGSLCLSLILLIVLGAINGRNPLLQRASEVSLSPRIIDNAAPSETDRITAPLEKTLFLTSEKMNSEKNYRVLKEYQEFKLVEYTLFDGSKIIAVENILL